MEEADKRLDRRVKFASKIVIVGGTPSEKNNLISALNTENVEANLSLVKDKFNAPDSMDLIEFFCRTLKDSQPVFTQQVFRGSLLIQDCFNDVFFKHKVAQDIYHNSRHWNMRLVQTVGSDEKLPHNLRSCIDYIFIGKEEDSWKRKKIFREFVEGMDYEDFNEAMNVLENKGNWLVVDKTGRAVTFFYY